MRAAEHLLADIGNRAAATWRCSGQALHRARRKAGFVADHDRHDRAARLLLFVGDEVADIGHRHDRNLAPQALGEPFLRGALFQPRNDLALDVSHMLQAIDAHGQRRIVAQFRQPQHLAKRPPLRRGYRGDAEPALLGFVDAGRERRPEPVNPDAPHDVAVHERLEHDVFGHRDAGFEDAQGVRASPPVLHPAQHRGSRRDKAPEAGEDAGLEIRRMHRRPLDRPDQFYQSGQRANGRVRRFEFRIRPLAAEPAGIKMDKAGVALLDRSKIESRTIRRIDVAAVEQDVARRDQFGQASDGARHRCDRAPRSTC